MREVELKAVVPQLTAARQALEAAGARLVFEGRLEDRRYDTEDRQLRARDHVLRLRIYRDAAGARTLLDQASASRALLDWKGATQYTDGYKVREELSIGATDPDVLADVLARLGYVVTREIDREIAQYEIAGAVVRFECYPRMDVLVEVEGEPEAIERAIVATGLARESFTTERLPAFVARFEARTGERAALCDRELRGDYRYRPDDA